MPEMDLFFVLPLITASLKVFFIIWNNTTIILAPVPRVPKFGAPFPFLLLLLSFETGSHFSKTCSSTRYIVRGDLELLILSLSSAGYRCLPTIPSLCGTRDWIVTVLQMAPRALTRHFTDQANFLKLKLNGPHLETWWPCAVASPETT